MSTPTNTAGVFAQQLLGLASNGGISGLPPGNYDTPGNRTFIIKWVNREGGGGAFNPLNTTLKEPGSTPLAGNSAGVQNYPYYTEGVNAIATTIGNGYYPDIVAAIASGHADQIDAAGGLAAGLSKWSGGSYTTVSGASADPNHVISSSGPDVGVVTPDQWGLPSLGALTSWEDGLKKLLSFLTTRSNWIRIGEFALGLVLVGVGLMLLFRKQLTTAGKIAAIA